MNVKDETSCPSTSRDVTFQLSQPEKVVETYAGDSVNVLLRR